MTFKEALEVVHSIDKDKWFHRLDYKRNDFVMLGCEGRFMRRKNWVPGKYVISTTLFYTPSYVHIPEQFMCTNLLHKEEISTFDWGETLQNDWEVRDFIPSSRDGVIVDPENNKLGLWSKYEHKCIFKCDNPKMPYPYNYTWLEETDEYLPYWDDKLGKYIDLSKQEEQNEKKS